jgi:hypothetical protein
MVVLVNGSSPAPLRPMSPPYLPRAVLAAAVLLTLLVWAGGTALDRLPENPNGSPAVLGLAPPPPRRSADTQASRDSRPRHAVPGAPSAAAPPVRRSTRPATAPAAPAAGPTAGVAPDPSVPVGVDPGTVRASYTDVGGIGTVRVARISVINQSTVDQTWQVEFRYPDAVRSMRLMWSADPSAEVARHDGGYVLRGARAVAGGVAMTLVRLDTDSVLSALLPTLCVVNGVACQYR